MGDDDEVEIKLIVPRSVAQKIDLVYDARSRDDNKMCLPEFIGKRILEVKLEELNPTRKGGY